MTPLELVLSKLPPAKLHAGQHRTNCPAHDDRHPSLDVKEDGPGGPVGLQCRSQVCATEDIVAAMGLTMSDLFPDRPSTNGHRQIAAEYDYTDEGDDLLFQVVRFEPKDFRQRAPDGSGGWVWKTADVRKVLYRLPRVLDTAGEGGDVFIVEGERDVHAAEAAGVVATCNPGGAGKWRDEYAEPVRGARVFVVADRDDPGRAHARLVAASLEGVAKEVRVLEPAHGKDLADHLAAGLALSDLRPLTDENADEPDHRALKIASVADICARIDAAPPATFLIRGVIASDAYGVIAATDKSGKSWAELDLAIAVASGTPWFGAHEVERPGPVLVFYGEGSERRVIRRLRAICAAKGLRLEELPIRLCARVPHLSAREHLDEIKTELLAYPAVLVILDPLYLAARGAKGSDLYEMGAHLEAIQHVCQDGGAALMVVTHYNKTGEGKGAKRITGVGPGAWGRVLITAEVVVRRTDENGMTTVVLTWHYEGDEIPDADLRMRRKVWADDRNDINSPLHYDVEMLTEDAEAYAVDERGLSYSARLILGIMQNQPGEVFNVKTIGDALADDDHPLHKRTIQTAFSALVDGRFVDTEETGPGVPGRWWVPSSVDDIAGEIF